MLNKLLFVLKYIINTPLLIAAIPIFILALIASLGRGIFSPLNSICGTLIEKYYDLFIYYENQWKKCKNSEIVTINAEKLEAFGKYIKEREAEEKASKKETEPQNLDVN